MTRISSIRTSGFKGIDDLEVEPGRINIITGRNNTGKTSFLESINICFNPTSIEEFSKNLDKVVNVNNSTCSISPSYIQTQRTLQSYGSESNMREFAMREPNEKEAVDIFTRTLQDIMRINEDYPLRSVQRHFSDNFDSNELGQLIENTLEESVSTLSRSEILPDAEENIIIIELGGNEYPYIHLGEFYDDIRDLIISKSMEKIQNEINLSLVSSDLSEENEDEIDYVFYRGLREQLVPRFGSDRFVGGEPDAIEGVRLVYSPLLESEDVDMSKTNAAVKRSDIEEYLKENQIIDNLTDFSFDKIVFKEGNEKSEIPYSFMGDGFKTLVGILWEIMDDHRSENILLLEEPDVHMHPGYIENLLGQLVELVRKNGIQLFITSHNLDFIEGVLF